LLSFGPKSFVFPSYIKKTNLLDDELHNLYSSLNIVRVIKSRRMSWPGHMAHRGRGEVFTRFWLGGPKGRDHWEDLGIWRRITLRWTLGR
jgi:hypothetical protein